MTARLHRLAAPLLQLLLLLPAALLAAVSVPAPAPAAPGPDDTPVRHDAAPLVDGAVDLAGCDWTKDGARVTWEQDGDVVPLSSDGRGTRWATVFATEEGFQARLSLQWVGGPDGYLYELQVDGQRVPPARDAWRPTRRPITSDLGSVWLGPGRHLVEFIAREQSQGAIHVHRLLVERLDG